MEQVFGPITPIISTFFAMFLLQIICIQHIFFCLHLSDHASIIPIIVCMHLIDVDNVLQEFLDHKINYFIILDPFHYATCSKSMYFAINQCSFRISANKIKNAGIQHGCSDTSIIDCNIQIIQINIL
jgi:hypothetical protein